jgi:ribosomal protein S12 methylthiotransferase accessory factor
MRNNIVSDPSSLPFLSSAEREIVSAVFSEKVGVINAVLKRYELSHYGLYMYQCLSADTREVWGLSKDVSSGGLGLDFDERRAFLACLGEAIERYCMSFPTNKSWLTKEWRKLSRNLKPVKLSLHTPNQYISNGALDDPSKKAVPWVKLKGAFEPKKSIYWPASLVSLPYNLSWGKVGEATSTGVSAHPDRDMAIQGGLLEIIERDALMINFYQQLCPPQIDLGSLIGSSPDSAFIKKIRKSYHVVIYRLFSDVNIPITLAYIWRNNSSKGVHFGIGAAADLDLDMAINKSLREALFTYFYSWHLMDLKQDDPDLIPSLHQHFLFYQGHRFQMLLKEGGSIGYSPERYDKKHLVDQLEINDLTPYYLDLTTPDIKGSGISVIRTVVPGLIDLNRTHNLLREGAERFWSVPKKLGINTRKGLSSWPHPFP